MATALMIVVLLALMPLRVPVCAAMGLSAIVGLAMLDMPFNTLVRYMATDVRSVPLLAIPFFVLAGNMMNQFGMTRRISPAIIQALEADGTIPKGLPARVSQMSGF